MEIQAQEILKGINKPVMRDATSVSIKDSTPIPGEKPEESSRFNAMEKAGILQAAAVLASPFFGKKVKKQGGVNVFSGFDGASGAQTGLRKAGVPINKYYASEIDKTAIGFTQHNYPETIQLGDIRDIDVSKLGSMDYGFFGFPCQSLSSANHNGKIGLRDMTTGEVLATLDQYEAAKAAGHKLSSSSLFYEALKQAVALKKINPEVRLSFENVSSMRPEFRKIIDDNLKLHLDLDPAFEMNTKGPTNRKRILWTNAITADDYNALSERIKQVMPEDIIDQKAHHNLSAKSAKDAQTDLFEDNGALIPTSGKFEPKTNPWLKGKLNTATASGGAGKLVKNGLEYDMTKKEMNRSQGNPDDFGLDYGITDRQFAKLIGNGWDQFQFKPIFDRAAMEAKGNIPKSEGRLGDENRMRQTNEILHDAGMPYMREATVPKYGDYNAPEEHITVYPHVSKRLYRASSNMPTDGIKLSKVSPNTPVAKDMGYFDNKTLDYLASKFMPDQSYPTAAEDRGTLLQMLVNAVKQSRLNGIDYYDVMSKIPSRDIQVANQKSERSKYGRYRPESWFADSKARLSTGPKGSYGSADHLVQLPPRELLRMAKEGTLSVRPSHLPDNIVNIAEEVPQKYIMPIPKFDNQSKLDFLYNRGYISKNMLDDMNSLYVGQVPDWVWSNTRGILALKNSPSTVGYNDYLDYIVNDRYDQLPDELVKIYEPNILSELQKRKTPLASYPAVLQAGQPRDKIAQSIIDTFDDSSGHSWVNPTTIDKYVPDIIALPNGPALLLQNIHRLCEVPAALDFAVKRLGPQKVAHRLGHRLRFVEDTLPREDISNAVVDIANYIPSVELSEFAKLPAVNRLKPQTVARILTANGDLNAAEMYDYMSNLSPQMVEQVAGVLGTKPSKAAISEAIRKDYNSIEKLSRDLANGNITEDTSGLLESIPGSGLEELGRQILHNYTQAGRDPNNVILFLNMLSSHAFPPTASTKFDLITEYIRNLLY